jgi:hypothetical protein
VTVEMRNTNKEDEKNRASVGSANLGPLERQSNTTESDMQLVTRNAIAPTRIVF